MKSNPIRFVPWVMFVWFVFTVVMVVVTNEACAERQVFLKDGILTVWVDVMRIADVPKEITDAEVAHGLVIGQLKEAKVEITGETTRSFAFLWIKKKTGYSSVIVKYSGKWSANQWSITPVANRFKEKVDIINTFFMYFGLLVLAVLLYALRVIMKNTRAQKLKRCGY